MFFSAAGLQISYRALSSLKYPLNNRQEIIGIYAYYYGYDRCNGQRQHHKKRRFPYVLKVPVQRGGFFEIRPEYNRQKISGIKHGARKKDKQDCRGMGLH